MPLVPFIGCARTGESVGGGRGGGVGWRTPIFARSAGQVASSLYVPGKAAAAPAARVAAQSVRTAMFSPSTKSQVVHARHGGRDMLLVKFVTSVWTSAKSTHCR